MCNVVVDRPAPPVNASITNCYAMRATVSWDPGFDNNDAIIGYTVYYNTTFDTMGYDHAAVDTNWTEVSVDLLPWRNYSFHVRSRNSHGISDSSALTQERCSSPATRPAFHPNGVCTRSRGSRQLVIVWQVSKLFLV